MTGTYFARERSYTATPRELRSIVYHASLGLGTIRPVALVRQIFTENDQFSLPRLKPVAEKQ